MGPKTDQLHQLLAARNVKTKPATLSMFIHKGFIKLPWIFDVLTKNHYLQGDGHAVESVSRPIAPLDKIDASVLLTDVETECRLANLASVNP